MARVPYNPAPEPITGAQPVRPMEIPAVPAAFGSTVAGAVEHLGGTMQNVGGELFQRAIAMQDLRNEAESTKGLADYELASSRQRDQFLSSEGMNSVQGLEAFNAAQRKAFEDARAGLSNDAARRMFDRAGLGVYNRALIVGASHAADQQKKYNIHANTSALDAFTNNQAPKAGSIEELETKIFPEMDNWLDRNAHMQGIDDPSATSETIRNEARFTQRSKAYSRWLMTQARANPLAAWDAFIKLRDGGKLSATDQEAVEGRITSLHYDAVGRVVENDIRGDIANPEGFLERHVKPGEQVNTHGSDARLTRQLSLAIMDYEAAHPNGDPAQINSMFRTDAEQQALIAAGRRAAPVGPGAHHTAQGGGTAADIHQNGFLTWLQQNASTYGLEFTIPSEPWHVEITSDGRAPRRTLTDVSEQTIMQLARNRAARFSGYPEDNPATIHLQDTTQQRVVQAWRQQKAADNEAEARNLLTVQQAIADNKPQRLEDVLADPQVRSAYESMDFKRQQIIRNDIASINRVPSADAQEEYNRINGLRAYPERAQEFLDATTPQALEANEKLRNSPRFRTELLNRHLAVTKGEQLPPHVSEAVHIIEAAGIIPPSVRNDPNKMAIIHGALFERMEAYRKTHPTQPMKKEDIENLGRWLLQDHLEQYNASAWVGRDVISTGTVHGLLDRTPTSQEIAEIKEEFRRRTNGRFDPGEDEIYQTWIRNKLEALQRRAGTK